MTLAILDSYMPNQGDAWQYTLDTLHEYFTEVEARRTSGGNAPVPEGHLLDMLELAPSPLAHELIGFYLERASLASGLVSYTWRWPRRPTIRPSRRNPSRISIGEDCIKA